jgi:hypothetical protein
VLQSKDKLLSKLSIPKEAGRLDRTHGSLEEFFSCHRLQRPEYSAHMAASIVGIDGGVIGSLGSIPTAPTNHLSDWSGLNKLARGQKGADKPIDPVLVR